MSKTPLDNSLKKSKRTKRILLWCIVLSILCVVIAVMYAKSVQNAPQTLKKGNEPPASQIKGASATAASSSAAQKSQLPESSPANAVASQTESIEKAKAQKTGNSHIDSTTAIEEKARQEEAKKPKTQKPPVAKKKQTQKKSSNQNQKKKVEVTREQIIAKNISSLLGGEPYMPPEAPVVQETETMLKKIDSTPTVDTEIDGLSAQIWEVADNKVADGKQAPSARRDTMPVLASSSGRHSLNGQLPIRNQRTGELEYGDSAKNKQEQVRVINMGQRILTELRYNIVSDYDLPVFFDVVEPDLRDITLYGKFEMTEMQDGLLLRVTRLQKGDTIINVRGYGIDIADIETPHFDNEVDTHFVDRTLARASAAFMVPFLDFVTNTSTVISNGNVVITKDPVTDLSSQLIGGAASVAKEFLPDLTKRKNIKPTISIPNNYPVAVVFAEPVYLPKALFDDDPTTAPDKHFKNLKGDAQ